MNKKHIRFANGSRISFSEEPIDYTYKYQSSGGLIYFEPGEVKMLEKKSGDPICLQQTQRRQRKNESDDHLKPVMKEAEGCGK